MPGLTFKSRILILPAMFSRPAKWLVVFALVLTTGGHWFALQSIGWVSMVVSFAQTDSLDVAIKKTFDGKHPCRICKSVAAGRESEQKQPVLKMETKLDFWIIEPAFHLPQIAVTSASEALFDASHSSRT